MKRLSRATPGRMLIALHVAALLAGCATLEAPPPRYGSIKDDPVAAADVSRETSRRVVKVAQRSGDWSPGVAAKQAPKVEARPIKVSSAAGEAVPAKSTPPVKTAQEPPPAATSVSPRPPAPEKAQANASSTTTTTEAAEARVTPRPGPVERPGAIERPALIDRDGMAARTERPSTEARRSVPGQEGVPPSAEPKARPAAPAPSPETKAAMAPQPPAAKPAPAPSVTPPAPAAPASAATPQPAPKAAAQQPPPVPPPVKGKQPQVPLGPADQLGAPGSITALIERSELLLRIGNVSEARDVLTPGVNSSSPEAITALAKTYDPNELKAFLVPPGTSDVAKAAQLYTEAARLGSLDARRRLERLRSTPAETLPAQPGQPAPKK